MLALRDQARGRWPAILPSFGLPIARLNGKHGPCPICGHGKDRFRFDDKDGRGTWFCSHCGAGDGITFVEKIRGVDFKGAVALIEPLVGAAPVQARPPSASDDDKRRWRNETWAGARPISQDDAAGRFLLNRAGVLSYPTVLRYHPNLDHSDDNGKRSRHRGMLAIVTAPDGRPANLHRTYLDDDGAKADVAEPRRMMPGEIPDGSAIRLAPAAETLGIAEGIETAFAASALFGVPCWAAINATILAKWTPPAATRRVIVFGDNDAGFAGQAAAFTLARSIAGRRLADVDVRIPETDGDDWNDVFSRQGKIR